VITQQYSSALTSIKQVPALHRHHQLFSGKSVLDYGGGKYDLGIDYLKDAGFDAQVYDPFNRTPEHNSRVLSGEYHTVLLSNVLNVIREKTVRLTVIAHALEVAEEVFITVYYDGNKQEGETPKGYQMHKRPSFYVQEIKEAFPHLKISTIKGGIIKITSGKDSAVKR